MKTTYSKNQSNRNQQINKSAHHKGTNGVSGGDIDEAGNDNAGNSQNVNQSAHKVNNVVQKKNCKMEKVVFDNRIKRKNVLALNEKVAAIREYEKRPVYKRIGRMFHCSPDQIKRIVQQKEAILSAWEQRTRKRDAKTLEMKVVRVSMLGKAVYEWIRRMMYYKDILITDGLIQKMALQFKSVMGLQNFFPHQDWCDKFRRIYKITEIDSKLLSIGYTTGHSVQIRDVLKDVLTECSPSDEDKNRKDTDGDSQYDYHIRRDSANFESCYNGDIKENNEEVNIDIDDDDDDDDDNDNDNDNDNDTMDIDASHNGNNDNDADENGDENKNHIIKCGKDIHDKALSGGARMSLKRSSLLSNRMRREHHSQLVNTTSTSATATTVSPLLPSCSSAATTAVSSKTLPLSQLPNLRQLVAVPIQTSGIGGVVPQKILVATPLNSNSNQRPGVAPLTMTIIPIATIAQSGSKGLTQIGLNAAAASAASSASTASAGQANLQNTNKNANTGIGNRGNDSHDYNRATIPSPMLNIKTEIKQEPSDDNELLEDEDQQVEEEEEEEDEEEERDEAEEELMDNRIQRQISNGNDVNNYSSHNECERDTPIEVVDIKKEYISDEEEHDDDMLGFVRTGDRPQDLRDHRSQEHRSPMPMMPNLVAIPSSANTSIREESNDSMEENLVLSKLQRHIRNQNTSTSTINNKSNNNTDNSKNNNTKNGSNNFQSGSNNSPSGSHTLTNILEGMVCLRETRRLPSLQHQKRTTRQSPTNMPPQSSQQNLKIQVNKGKSASASIMKVLLKDANTLSNDSATTSASLKAISTIPMISAMPAMSTMPTIPPMPPLTRAPPLAHINTCTLEYNNNSTLSGSASASNLIGTKYSGVDSSGKRLRSTNDQHAPMAANSLAPIRTFAEARAYLKILEDFALERENFRLIALITRADEVLRELDRKENGSDNEEEDVSIE